jgi:hypothetical protein
MVVQCPEGKSNSKDIRQVRMYRYQWKALESAIVIPLPIVARRIKPNKKRDINEIVPPTEKIIVSSLLCEAVMLDDTPAEKLVRFVFSFSGTYAVVFLSLY